MRTRLLLPVFLLLAPLLMGQATCPEGKVLGWDQATCCWPGQNVGPFGCTGKPTACPEGLIASDDGCVNPTSQAALRSTYHPGLLDPREAAETAPEEYTVVLETTKGDVLIDVVRAWAPQGADRFYNLVRIGHYDGVAFFRVIDGFMAQVGIHGDPKVAGIWANATIQDDPVVESNQPGFVSFAMAGANSRTTQIFFNTVDNHRLDSMGFAPFGRVRDLKPILELYAGYGEGAPRGRGPDQNAIRTQGNAYLRASYPNLDWIKEARVLKPEELKALEAASSPPPEPPAE